MGRRPKIQIKDFMDDLADSFISGNTGEAADIISFATAPWGLNFPLRPVQTFILKSMYGLPLDDKDKIIDVPDIVNDKILYNFTEKEFLQWMIDEGRCNTKEIHEGKIFRELILVVGRRGSKSTISALISSYEMYKLIKYGDPSAHYGFPPDTMISICNVAPTDEQANIVFSNILSMSAKSLCLRDRILNQTQTYFNLMSDADSASFAKKKRANIVVIAGGCSSSSLRGRNNIAVILDEMAFFIDNGGRFAGDAVYKALTPSTASFGSDGKVLCISSPYAKYGAFYDRYIRSFEEQETTLMFKMYSALANPTVDNVHLKTERRRDKINFMCEYGGEFSDSVVAWIDDEPTFRKNINVRKAPIKGVVNEMYFMGVDLAAKNDGTSIAIVHRDNLTKKIVLDYANVWFAAESDVWDRNESIYEGCTKYKHLEFIRVLDIVDEIEELSKWFPIRDGWFDQWSGYALLEALQNKELKQFRTEHVSDSLNSEMYTLLKSLYMENMLDLFDHEILIPELLSLEAELKSRNKIKVRAPNKAGAHDDISDAFARAVWSCFNWDKERQINRTSGTIGASDGVKTYNMHQMEKVRAHGIGSRAANRLTASGRVRSNGFRGRGY